MIFWLNRALTVAIDALSDAKRAEGFDGVTDDILEYLLLARSHGGESQVKEQLTTVPPPASQTTNDSPGLKGTISSPNN